jgi:hypothetical protein
MDAAGRDTVLSWRGARGRMRGLSYDPFPEAPFHDVAANGSGVAIAECSDTLPGSLVLRIVAPDASERWRRALIVHTDTVTLIEHDSIVDDARANVGELREYLLKLGLPPRGTPEVPTVAEVRERLRLPSHRPPVRAIRFGADGTLWLELRRTTEGATWLAIDTASRPILTVNLPAAAVFGPATRASLWYSELDDTGAPWVVRARFTPRQDGASR